MTANNPGPVEAAKALDFARQLRAELPPGSWFRLDAIIATLSGQRSRPAGMASGDLHTAIMDALNKALMSDHPEAFHEETEGSLIIPQTSAGRRMFTNIDVSQLAEGVLPIVEAAQPAESGAVTWLKDVGGYASDGEWDECFMPASKGDPGAFPVYAHPKAPDDLTKIVMDALDADGLVDRDWVDAPACAKRISDGIARALPPTPPAPPAPDAVERAAPKVYDAMRWAVQEAHGATDVPEWREGGNSHAQDVARAKAAEILAVPGSVGVGSEEMLLEAVAGSIKRAMVKGWGYRDLGRAAILAMILTTPPRGGG